MLDYKIFLEGMNKLGLNYEKDISDKILSLYYDTVKLNDEEFQLAISKTISTKDFFPRPSQLNKIIKGNELDNKKIMMTLAASKFREILQSGSSIRCDDPYIVQTLLIMGGIDDLRRSDSKNVVWLEKEFAEKYEAQLGCRLRDNLPEVLYNLRDTRNIRAGFEPLKIKLIGEKERYLRWTNKLKSIKGKIKDSVKKIESLNNMKVVVN